MMTEMSVLRSNEGSSGADSAAVSSSGYQPLQQQTFAEDSIFAGLSFPQVPLTVPARAQPVDATLIPSAPTHLPAGYPVTLSTPMTPTAPPSLVVDYDTSNQYIEDEQMLETTSLLGSSAAPVADAQQQRRKASNLSSLYSTPQQPASTEVHHRSIPVAEKVDANKYPELPSMMRREAPPVMGTSLPSTTATTRPPQQSATSTITTIESNPNNTLVNELLQENSRLTDEVTRLRLIMEQQQTQQTTPQVNVSTFSPMTHQHQQQQTQFMAPQMNHNAVVSSQAPLPLPPQQQHLQQLPPNSNTAITASLYQQNPALAANPAVGTAPPGEGVKYVCCGGCQQWLVAPRTAVYVVCSRCQSVNNCNIATAPPGTVPNDQARQIETNALTYHRDTGPWYLDCFRQFF